MATSSGTRPPLNEIITPSRAPWVMSPCSARDVHPAVAQRAVQLIAADLGADEDRAPGRGARPRAPSTSASFLSCGATSSANCSTVSTVSVSVLTLIDHRVVQVLVGQPPDLGRHRRREQRRLPAGRGQREDLLDVLQEAEVEHLVGLVEHDEAAGVQHQRMAADQVLDAADGADHDLAAGAQLRLLAADRRAAEHRDDVDTLALPVGAQRLGDLDAQLARRRQHESLDVALVGIDVLQHRQTEGRGLARAGLRLADHVESLRAAAGSPAPGSGSETS